MFMLALPPAVVPVAEKIKSSPIKSLIYKKVAVSLPDL